MAVAKQRIAIVFAVLVPLFAQGGDLQAGNDWSSLQVNVSASSAKSFRFAGGSCDRTENDRPQDRQCICHTNLEAVQP